MEILTTGTRHSVKTMSDFLFFFPKILPTMFSAMSVTLHPCLIFTYNPFLAKASVHCKLSLSHPIFESLTP